MRRDRLPKGLPAGLHVPGGAVTLARLEADASALTARALDEGSPVLARRAIAARREAELARLVANWQVPSVARDAGPSRAAGRGGLEAADVAVMAWSEREQAMVPQVDRVVRRAASRTLRGLPPGERNTAEIYAGLAEQRGAMRCPDLVSAAGGGGDGMADLRRALRGINLSLAEAAIGDGLALKAQRRSRTDLPMRRAVRVRALVDAVCLDGRTISDVLGRHGWARNKAACKALRAALSAALQRMARFIG